MVALGLGTVWAGYYLFLYGYCLVRGYDVSLPQLMHSTWPGSGTSASKAAPTGQGSGGGGGHVLAN